MQKLHLVGFTRDLDGLILSTRKGAKSGSFVVLVDESLLKMLADTKSSTEPAARTNGVRHVPAPRQTRPESQLGPREMQDLLRGGWSLEEVAVEARVDVDWVSRFAAPVMAEMRLVLDQARETVFDKPRFGPSALALAPSVRRNIAERGVRFTDEDFDAAWRAHQLDDALWGITFEYKSRSRMQSAEWVLDLDTGELASGGRLGTQLGHVQSTRRRVSTAPPPKPKPKAAVARAVAKPPPVVVAPGRRVLPAPPPPRRASTAKATTTRPRARKQGTRSPSASTARVATPKPRAATPVPAQVQPLPSRPRRDPWREELRRREAETAAHAPPPVSTFLRSQVPRIEPEPESERGAPSVAIIGPTVRTLRRRPPEPARAPTPPPRKPSPPRSEHITGPIPAVSESEKEPWPDLEWSPGVGRPASKPGPLPAPGPLRVPDDIREKVASPLGRIEDDDDTLTAETWFPPARPTSKGAKTATPARPRRSEPLRGR